MRLTTKIIAGIILSIFFLSLLFIIGLSFTGRKNHKGTRANITAIPDGNKIGIAVEPYRVVVLEVERSEPQSGSNYGFTSEKCGMFLNPVTSNEEENKLFISEALNGFISAKTDNDTLTVKIKTDELRGKYDDGNDEYSFFSGINLYLHTANVDVVNKVGNFSIKVSNIETDSIKINSSGDVLIESCKAIVIDPVLNPNYRTLTVKNCIAQTILLDIDRINRWNIEECNIETQNITGSGRHNITLHRNEAGKINWHPKNKDAELNIKMQGDSAQIMYLNHL